MSLSDRLPSVFAEIRPGKRFNHFKETQDVGRFCGANRGQYIQIWHLLELIKFLRTDNFLELIIS
jgi:hypothetical protein